MATSSGTSVVGMQSLITAVTTTDDKFAIELSGDSATPPSRVGYYYLVRYNQTTGLTGRVTNAGIIWSPGIRFIRELLPTDTANRYRLWADWNFAGMSWSVSTN